MFYDTNGNPVDQWGRPLGAGVGQVHRQPPASFRGAGYPGQVFDTPPGAAGPTAAQLAAMRGEDGAILQFLRERYGREAVPESARKAIRAASRAATGGAVAATAADLGALEDGETIQVVTFGGTFAAATLTTAAARLPNSARIIGVRATQSVANDATLTRFNVGGIPMNGGYPAPIAAFVDTTVWTPWLQDVVIPASTDFTAEFTGTAGTVVNVALLVATRLTSTC